MLTMLQLALFANLMLSLQFSREKVTKPHKLIVFIGRNSQDKLNNISNSINLSINL